MGLDGGINLYAYVNNNPLMFTDPEGLKAKEFGRSVWNETVNFSNTFNQVLFSPLVAANTTVGWVDNQIYEYTGISPDDQVGLMMAAGGPVAGEGFALCKSSLKTISNFATSITRYDVLRPLANEVGAVGSIDDLVSLKKVDLSPTANPQRVHGPWTQRDLARANEGKGPLDFIPTTNRAGREVPLELHHADQMPGSAVHEVAPFHSKIEGVHPNKYNQGVTPKMRQEDAQLHWYLRGKEMGNP